MLVLSLMLDLVSNRMMQSVMAINDACKYMHSKSDRRIGKMTRNDLPKIIFEQKFGDFLTKFNRVKQVFLNQCDN